VRADIQVVAA